VQSGISINSVKFFRNFHLNKEMNPTKLSKFFESNEDFEVQNINVLHLL
jgi:hypothetical protein